MPPDALSEALQAVVRLGEHVERARAGRLPHVYLGYLVADCRKMAYKARFQPLEGHGPEGWTSYKPR